MRPTAYIAMTLLFDIIDREAKELLPRIIFIITRRYKRVEIRQQKSCRLTRNIEFAYKGLSDPRGEIPLGVI